MGRPSVAIISPPNQLSGIGLYSQIVSLGLRRCGAYAQVSETLPKALHRWDIVHFQVGSSRPHASTIAELRRFRAMTGNARSRPVAIATVHDGDLRNAIITDLPGVARRILHRTATTFGVDLVLQFVGMLSDNTIVLSSEMSRKLLWSHAEVIPHPVPRLPLLDKPPSLVDCTTRILVPGYIGPNRVGCISNLLEALEDEKLWAEVAIGSFHPAVSTEDRRNLEDRIHRSSKVRRLGFLTTTNYLREFSRSHIVVIAATRTAGEVSAGYYLAAAAGVPTILPDFPQYKDFIDSSMELFYDPGYPKSLKRSIRHVVSTYELWKDGARRKRDRLLRDQSIERVGQRHLAMYARYIDKPLRRL